MEHGLYYLLHVSARSEAFEIYNCDKFSIEGPSFTGIVKNARILSHRCDITYARTASNLPPEIQVDHVHVNIHALCTCYLNPPPTLNLGPGNHKDIDISLSKARIYALH